MAYRWHARGERRITKIEIRRIDKRGSASGYKEIQASSGGRVIDAAYTLLDKQDVLTASFKHMTRYIYDEFKERMIMT